MYSTSSAVVATLLVAIFTSSPVTSQETLTLVYFGGDSVGEDILLSAAGQISASTQFVPIGTANGGSETTFAYEEVDVFTTTNSNGSPTTYTETDKGTMIASASGFKISFTVAAIPTEIAQALKDGPGVGIGGSEACSFINPETGECAVEFVAGDASTTLTVSATVTGDPHTQLIPLASPSQSAGNGGGNSGGDRKKDSSALGHSSNGVAMVGVAVGILLGFMRVF